jgi:hypothetical protein
MLRCASAFSIPVEARFSTQPFALRQRWRIFQSVPAAGSTLLASRLRCDPDITFKGLPCDSLPPSPFGFTLPPASGFLSPPAVRSTHVARCQVQRRNSPSVFGSLLLFGTSQSLWITASNPIPDAEACPCESPDLPSLPVTLQIIAYPFAPRIIVPDPLLPARLAVLRTSRNHLHDAPG